MISQLSFHPIIRNIFLWSIFSVLFSSCATIPKHKEQQTNREIYSEYKKGRDFFDQGMLSEAEEKLLSSLKKSQSSNSEKWTARNLEMLALIRLQEKNSDEAHQYLDQALILAEKNNDKILTSSILNLLAKMHTDKREYKKANDFYRRSLYIDSITGNTMGEGVTSNNIGKLLFLTGEKKEALNYYLRAIELFIDLNDKERAKVVLNNIRLLNEQNH